VLPTQKKPAGQALISSSKEDAFRVSTEILLFLYNIPEIFWYSNDTFSPSIWKSTRRNVQFETLVDSAGLMLRLGQFAHAVAAKPEANVPALHALHVEDSFKEAKVPGRQSSHELIPL